MSPLKAREKRLFTALRGLLPRPLTRAFLILPLALFAAACRPSLAFDLFAKHEVTVHFATPEGEPLAQAPVRVFAPGKSARPVLTGQTDAKGDFSFAADKNGFWTAEASGRGEVARVMVRVGREPSGKGFLARPPLLRVLAALLVLAALGYSLLRRRRRSSRPAPDRGREKR